MPQMPYGNQQPQVAQQQGMFTGQPPQPQQQWYPNQQGHPTPQQYAYGQQLPPSAVGGPRYDRPGMNNQSKQALSNMLRLRLPSTQFMGSQQQPNAPPAGGPAGFQGMQRQQFIRQQLRAQHSVAAMNPQQAMFNPQQQQPQQQGMYAGMQQGI